MKVSKDKNKTLPKKKMNKRQRKIQLVQKKSKVDKKKNRIKLHFLKFKPKNLEEKEISKNIKISAEGISKKKKKLNKSSKSKVNKAKEPFPKSILKKNNENNSNVIENLATAEHLDQIVNKKAKSKKRKSKSKNMKVDMDLKKRIDEQPKPKNIESMDNGNLEQSLENKKFIDRTENVKKSKKRKINATNSNWEKLKEDIHEETLKLLPPPSKFIRTEKTGTNHHKASKLSENDVWFDGVDPSLLGNDEILPDVAKGDVDSKLITNADDKSITKAVGLDCEMVGVGMNGSESMLARVSIVNSFGNVLYDKYVEPQEEVVDYRTEFSGIRKSDLIDGIPFSTVQKEVAEIIRGRLLIGHDLNHDLKCLFLSHPKKMIRDTAKYKPFRTLTGGGKPSLKKLSIQLLSCEIQSGEHDSVIDARAAMRMYTLNKKEWEALLKKNKPYRKGVKPEKTKDVDVEESL